MEYNSPTLDKIKPFLQKKVLKIPSGLGYLTYEGLPRCHWKQFYEFHKSNKSSGAPAIDDRFSQYETGITFQGKITYFS